MKFPLSWLKEYVDVTVEPEKLGDDLTAVGLAIEGIERDGKDVVLDFDITTNRVDCMNVYGLAREAALIYRLPLRPLAVDVVESGAPAAQALAVEIEAPDLCPRFCARVLDVRVGESPQWLKDRLEQVGVRPISNIVDLTNYVTMELGQPTHAFDLNRIPDGRLIVRWAQVGELLVTLDGQVRTLTSKIGVVAGGRGALGLAGIMGGRSSEVHAETQVVALEAAYWEPLTIRRAAKTLGMHTDASHRFERGADYGAAPLAPNRIAHLLGKIGGGSARPGLIDVVGRPQPRRRLVLRPERVDQLLGTRVPAGECERILKGLGFDVASVDSEELAVVVPAWRGDVTREIDLVEEVGRHRGLDSIPNSLPPATAPGTLAPHQRLERVLRRTLADLGFDEAVNYAFVPPTDWAAVLADETPVPLQNPLSAEQAVLRTSLIPGLVRNLQTNQRHGRPDVALFEIGRAFRATGGAGSKPAEPARLALLVSGAWQRRGFADQRPAEFADLQGVLEALAQRLGLETLELSAGPEPKRLPWDAWLGAYLHPQRWAHVMLGDGPIGVLAELHPRQIDALDLKGRVLVAEIDLDLLNSRVSRRPTVRTQALSRFPSVERDLAVLWPADQPSAALVTAASRAAGALLRDARVVDRYQSDALAGRVSLTLRLRFASPERTLTAEEVDAAVAAVVAGLPALGAEIRGV
jgi:phenylalanyl-tRNA synthetase beta chain